MYTNGIFPIASMLGYGNQSITDALLGTNFASQSVTNTLLGAGFLSALKSALASQSSDGKSSGKSSSESASTDGMAATKSRMDFVYKGINFDPEKPVYVVKIKNT